MLTDMVRTDRYQLRAVAGDSADAEAVKVVARTHTTLIWERARQVQGLRYQLRGYFPAALGAFERPPMRWSCLPGGIFIPGVQERPWSRPRSP